jgi:hypothetical protein
MTSAAVLQYQLRMLSSVMSSNCVNMEAPKQDEAILWDRDSSFPHIVLEPAVQ